CHPLVQRLAVRFLRGKRERNTDETENSQCRSNHGCPRNMASHWEGEAPAEPGRYHWEGEAPAEPLASRLGGSLALPMRKYSHAANVCSIADSLFARFSLTTSQ